MGVCVVYVVLDIIVSHTCCRCDVVVHGEIYGGLEEGVPRAWWCCVGRKGLPNGDGEEGCCGVVVCVFIMIVMACLCVVCSAVNGPWWILDLRRSLVFCMLV